MPAYKRGIPKHDCGTGGCHKRAAFEVFNTANASLGFYCGTHGDRLVAQLNAAAEATAAAAEAAANATDHSGHDTRQLISNTELTWCRTCQTHFPTPT